MDFTGVTPALLTPYDSNNKVSEDTLCRLMARYLEIGVNGLYLCGTAGEGVLQTVGERKRIVELAVKETAGKLRIIVHVGAVSTEDAAELAAHAEKVGADAISSIPPFFYRCDTEAIFQHYSAIARRCRLPFLFYNIPSLTGVTVTPKMMARLMDIPTCIGMKFSSNDLYQMRQIIELDSKRLQVVSGHDEVFLPALVMGARAGIGLTPNFMPKLFMEIFACFRAGKLDRAQDAQFLANRIISVVTQYNPIPATKEIMRWKGYDCGVARLPLSSLSGEQKRSLRDQLEALEFFNLELGL
jgi:N-acetylneuraminate lyase